MTTYRFFDNVAHNISYCPFVKYPPVPLLCINSRLECLPQSLIHTPSSFHSLIKITMPNRKRNDDDQFIAENLAHPGEVEAQAAEFDRDDQELEEKEKEVCQN